MNRRLQLHQELVKLLGNNHVYYKPPESLKMEYPCIRYSRSNIISRHADNAKYLNRNCYDLVVIDKKVDNPVIEKLLELPLTSFNRHYVADNLNHDVIRIYY